MIQMIMATLRMSLAAGLIGVLAGCASNPETPDGVQDPYERQNRSVHNFNVALDRALVGPVAETYGTTVPRPGRKAIANFASNLAMPGKIVNNILQLDIEGAGQNFMRFAFNTTFGLGGVIDVATEAGIPVDEADFGQTLYVWGVPEGNLISMPIIGPSTERHLTGRVVDLFTNPLTYIIDSPDNYIVTGTAVTLSGVDNRYEYSSTIEAILYESEDSYAQTRRLYLDNRRHQLGQDTSTEEADEIDALFEDLYGE